MIKKADLMDLGKLTLKEDGIKVLKNYFCLEELEGLKKSLDLATKKYNEIQCTKGLDSLVNGTLHHPFLFDDNFLDILDLSPELKVIIEDWFDGNFILNSYGGVTNAKESGSYVHSVHRDTRFYCGEYNLFMNLLLPLDNFTIENGATFILNKKYGISTKPSDEFFIENADRLVVDAGDAVLFDSNLWHKAGENKTDDVRRCITMTFSRPWIKAQFNFCSAVMRQGDVPEHLKQVLGYFARIPASENEWLLPEIDRFYKKGQDEKKSEMSDG